MRLRFIFILLFLVSLAALAGVWWRLGRAIEFANPLAPLFKPDLRLKVAANIKDPGLVKGDFDQVAPGLPTHLSYLAYNLDTWIAYAGRNIDRPLAPGSFTKLLTAMVALDLLPPEALLTASSQSVTKEPTVLGLAAGEQLTVAELVRASIATSANDAAATLAEGVAGRYGLTTLDYLNLMNHKAALIGMNASHFANPEGYDDASQTTTIFDLVRLVDNTANYPQILAAATADRQDLTATATHGFFYLPNWNALLGLYPGVFGLKIARTEAAGYATIVLARREDIRLAVIVSGAKTMLERDQSAAALLDQGFKKYKLKPANLPAAQIKARYQAWNDLAAKIRAELGLK